MFVPRDDRLVVELLFCESAGSISSAENGEHMNAFNFRWIVAPSILTVALAVGCKSPPTEAPEVASTPEAVQEGSAQEEALQPEVTEDSAAASQAAAEGDVRRVKADEADQMLRQRLMGKVMATVKEEGFVAAVNVCHGEAEPITKAVGEEMNVKIGRVSDRLRNPKNVGPDWVEELIETADGEAHYAVQDDVFRAVKPLPIAENCLKCHGQTDELAEGVASALDQYYPDDQATGYELGDIRGWVWVEVPETPKR